MCLSVYGLVKVVLAHICLFGSSRSFEALTACLGLGSFFILLWFSFFLFAKL